MIHGLVLTALLASAPDPLTDLGLLKRSYEAAENLEQRQNVVLDVHKFAQAAEAGPRRAACEWLLDLAAHGEDQEARYSAILYLGTLGDESDAGHLLEICCDWLKQRRQLEKTLTDSQPSAPNYAKLKRDKQKQQARARYEDAKRAYKAVSDQYSQVVKLGTAFSSPFVEIRCDDSVAGVSLLIEPLGIGGLGWVLRDRLDDPEAAFGSEKVFDWLIAAGTQRSCDALMVLMRQHQEAKENVGEQIRSLVERREAAEKKRGAPFRDPTVADVGREWLEGNLAALTRLTPRFAQKLAAFGQRHGIDGAPDADASYKAWQRWGKKLKKQLPKSMAAATAADGDSE